MAVIDTLVVTLTESLSNRYSNLKRGTRKNLILVGTLVLTLIINDLVALLAVVLVRSPKPETVNPKLSTLNPETPKALHP